MINPHRVWDRIEKIAGFGQTEEGITRLAYTATYRQAVDQVAEWMAQAGMTVRLDEAGNLIGRREGRDLQAAPVIIGSHIDSVVNAGKYDGVAGVIAGLEVAKHLEEEGILTIRPLEVIAFNEEEGARFGSGVFGSRAFAGAVTQKDLQTRDKDGVTRWEAIQAFGGDPAKLLQKREAPKTPCSMYLELHIEQGPVLEAREIPLGIVTGIVGMLVAEIRFFGEANHAGATPMDMRHDALLGACELACEVERLCKSGSGAALGTVGFMNALPGGVNIIPGQAEMTIDLRDLDMEVIQSTYKQIQDAAQKLAAARNLQVEFKKRMEVEPARCSREYIALVKNFCDEYIEKDYCICHNPDDGYWHDFYPFKRGRTQSR